MDVDVGTIAALVRRTLSPPPVGVTRSAAFRGLVQLQLNQDVRRQQAHRFVTGRCCIVHLHRATLSTGRDSFGVNRLSGAPFTGALVQDGCVCHVDTELAQTALASTFACSRDADHR